MTKAASLLLGTGPAYPTPAFSTYVEPFNDASNITLIGPGFAVTGGQLVNTISNVYPQAEANSVFVLRNSSIYFPLVWDHPIAAADEAYISLRPRGGASNQNQVQFKVSGSTLTFQVYEDAALDQASVTYDQTAHRWLRWSHTDADGIKWETSPDGTTWTTQFTRKSGNALRPFAWGISVGNYNNVASGTVAVDSINIAPGAAPVDTGKFFAFM